MNKILHCRCENGSCGKLCKFYLNEEPFWSLRTLNMLCFYEILPACFFYLIFWLWWFALMNKIGLSIPTILLLLPWGGSVCWNEALRNEQWTSFSELRGDSGYQQLKSRSMHYIPVTAVSWTDLFLDRISLDWESRGSAMTNHKKLICVTASLDRNRLSFTQKKYTKSRPVLKNAVTRPSMGVAYSNSLAPAWKLWEGICRAFFGACLYEPFGGFLLLVADFCPCHRSDIFQPCKASL